MNSVCYDSAVMLFDRIGITQLRDMAGRSERVVADVALADLHRIADLLSNSVAGDRVLTVVAQFGDHGHNFPEVDCHVTGELPLVCQRCLNTVEWNTDLKFRLAIVTSESDLDRVTEKFDAVVADEHGFDFGAAMTDEIIGALPLAPAHADRSECAVMTKYLAEDGAAEPSESEKTNRPFADLGNLLSGDGH